MSNPPPATSISQAFAPAREAVLLWVGLTTLAVIAVWIGGQYGERQLSKAIRNDAVNSARAAMLGLDPALHESIAKNEKMWSPLHKKALAILVGFHRKYPDVSRVRTFKLENGTVIVILDTETAAGDVGMQRPVDPTPLRTPLDEADPAFDTVLHVLKSREPAANDHSSDDGYRRWRPGVTPLGDDAALEADLSSVEQENALSNLKMWIGTGLGISVLACGGVALIFFNIRTSHLVSETTGGEAKRGQEWLEQRNGRLIEALAQVVLHRDLEAGYLLWDGDVHRILGTAIERMPMDFQSWLDRVHPDDSGRLRTATARTTSDRRTYELDYRARHENGNWRWFRERGVVSFTVEGDRMRPATVDSIIEDISDLKDEEEELAALALIASRTDNAICLMDVEGRIQWANSNFQRLTGVEMLAAEGKALTSLFVGAPGEADLLGLFREAAEGKGGRAEIRLLHLDGSAYWTNLELQPLKDDAGTINRLVAIQTDITATKEFEARIVSAKDAAETADRAKSEFLAVMSHEIRTPLNAVLGFTRLLLDTPLSTQQRDYIDTIRSSGDSLLHLLNDILDFSKMDAKGMQLENAPFDLRGCVEDTLDVLISPASTRGLDLYGDIGLDTPLAVVGDRTRLRQVLLNLAGNAVKFTDKGEVVISVRRLFTPIQSQIVSLRPPPSARLRFEVSDTGPGIPIDQQALLFRPFTQADSSATRKHGGTGLGLAISKRLITLMGGEIGLESVPGAGSTFWFEIPLDIAASQPAPLAGLGALEGLRVLLVEKNTGLRRMLSTQLHAWGLQVEAFGRGRDGLFAAEHRRFDVALLDCAPPDIDGLGLVDRLRHLPRRNVGGIILAGPPGKLPVATHGPFDALHRLVKPIHITVLAETLLRATPRFARTTIPRPVAALAAMIKPAQEPSFPARDSAASVDPKGRRILVADDNAINRKLVKKMLDGMGYLPALVTNGLECVEAIRSGEFDAILMDIQMPEMDGLAATRAIRDLGNLIPIIALTADAMPDDRARCLAAGMNDYLQKPVRPDALQLALARTAAGVGSPS